jgi:hypothetical protein
VPLLASGGRRFKDLNRNGRVDRYENWRHSTTSRALDLLARITLPEKAGLMVDHTAPWTTASPLYDLERARAFIVDKGINHFVTRMTGGRVGRGGGVERAPRGGRGVAPEHPGDAQHRSAKPLPVRPGCQRTGRELLAPRTAFRERLGPAQRLRQVCRTTRRSGTTSTRSPARSEPTSRARSPRRHSLRAAAGAGGRRFNGSC